MKVIKTLSTKDYTDKLWVYVPHYKLKHGFNRRRWMLSFLKFSERVDSHLKGKFRYTSRVISIDTKLQGLKK